MFSYQFEILFLDIRLRGSPLQSKNFIIILVLEASGGSTKATFPHAWTSTIDDPSIENELVSSPFVLFQQSSRVGDQTSAHPPTLIYGKMLQCNATQQASFFCHGKYLVYKPSATYKYLAPKIPADTQK